jgi:hypothetical protein
MMVVEPMVLVSHDVSFVRPTEFESTASGLTNETSDPSIGVPVDALAIDSSQLVTPTQSASRREERQATIGLRNQPTELTRVAAPQAIEFVIANPPEIEIEPRSIETPAQRKSLAPESLKVADAKPKDNADFALPPIAQNSERAMVDVRMETDSASNRRAAADEQPAVALTIPATPSHRVMNEQPIHTAAPESPADFEVVPSPIQVASTFVAANVAMTSDSSIKRDRFSDSKLTGITVDQLTEIDLGLPSEIAPPVNPYVQRSEDVRQNLVERLGGSEATERAVNQALQWLAAHQSEDGRWASAGFDDDCGECGGKGRFETDIATTGLALLCFLGADHTHVKDGPYRDRVSRALNWMLTQIKADGDLRGSETMYSHGIATIALSEALGMTHDDRLEEPVRRAIAFIVGARNRDTDAGGWRYEPGQMGDTSVLGWQVMAMISGRRAGIEVDDAALRAARNWIDHVSLAQRPGRYAYQPGQRFTPSMTAEGLFVLQLIGVSREEPRMSGSVEYVLEHPPHWDDRPNTYYWYYATLALFQHQGDAWTRWNDALKQVLLAHQRTSGPAAGSWDPHDNWSRIGGRVYQTALCTLCLEVYYRYLPMYAATSAPKP